MEFQNWTVFIYLLDEYLKFFRASKHINNFRDEQNNCLTVFVPNSLDDYINRIEETEIFQYLLTFSSSTNKMENSEMILACIQMEYKIL